MPSTDAYPTPSKGAYYIVAETLTNAAKHARASQVRVCADLGDDDLHISISDDGIGGAGLGNGSGRLGLKDRERPWAAG